MNVAVWSLTRDRIAYSQHCFRALRENAGVKFDHYVLDNGSTDDTREWLERGADDYSAVVTLTTNIGIPKANNRLLDIINRRQHYDVVVKIDNDCELTEPNTLRDVCRLVNQSDALLSPRILGLQHPPASQGMFEIDGEQIVDIPQIGGIFLAAPSRLYDRFRYPEHDERDDAQVCWWWRQHGGRCGYVERLTANHYETTEGQWARYPEYARRKYGELGLPSPV